MALRQRMTLGEMTQEVLDRSGLGLQTNLVADLHPQVHAYLREEQERIWQKFPHLRERIRVTIATTADVDTYDIPDEFEIGSIEAIDVRDINGQEWALEPGIRAIDRSLASGTSALTAYEPSRYDFLDGSLVVLRAPTDTVESLLVTGSRAPAVLREDGDRPTVDHEALVKGAVIKLKRYKRLGVDPAELAELDDYLMDVNSHQGVGETTVLGQWDDPNEAPLRRRQRPWWLADRRP